MRGLQECRDIDRNTPTSTYNGYLDFNGFLPKKLTPEFNDFNDVYQHLNSGSFGNEWKYAVSLFYKSEDLKNYASADNAMAACRQGNFPHSDIFLSPYE